MATPLTDLSDRVDRLHAEPIIAWQIQVVERDDESVSAEARPIVADPCCDVDECLWRRPNGSLFAPCDCELTNDAEAIAYFQEIEDMAAARRKKQALGPGKEKVN